MDEIQLLEQMKQSAKENSDYFSASNKEERERWVVSEFLSALDVKHQKGELSSLEQSNKADVRFRSAYFQVKELTDPKLRRHKMYKDAYNSIKAAKSLEDVSLIGGMHDMPPVANMYKLVLDMSWELANQSKYRALKGELDLLIYVTRTRAALIQPHEVNSEAFLDIGWRSVSCINTKQAVVLYSSISAPEFIRENLRVLMNIKS